MGLFGNSILIRDQLPPGRVRLVDGGYDREVVLEFIKVLLGAGHDAVEWVHEFRVVLAKTQLIDHVREVEAVVLDVLSGIPVSVSLRRDVEIALHPIHVHAPVDPAAVAVPAFRPKGLAKLALPRLFQNFVDMVLATADLNESVRARVVEGGRVLLKEVPGEDSVGRGVLDVDMEGLAVHGDCDVEVDLHLMADTRFDDEVLFFITREVRGELIVGEPDAGGEEKEGHNAAAGGARGVGCTSFCLSEGGDRVSKAGAKSWRSRPKRRRGTHGRHQRCVHSL